MAETAITAVLSKFGELATRELEVLLKVGDDIMLLRDRLEWLQAFIRDADRKRRVGADDLTRVWVRQTRDVAFEAEDALDEFFHKVDLESQGYRGWKMWSGYLTGSWTQVTIRRGLSGRIKRIKSRLEQISENQKEYKIDHSPPGIWVPSTTAVAAWDDLQSIVGFATDVTTVTKMLLDSDHRQKMFISILGESGLGKNTLVRKISSKVKKDFDVLIWYTMPPDSSMENLLRAVYDRATAKETDTVTHQDNEDPHKEVTDIADKLHLLLCEKKYLIIIGGISSKIILNCVGASFPENNKGSRVMLIFEPEFGEVARHADTLNQDTKSTRIHRLRRLDENKSGELFRRKVFGKKDQDTKAARGKKEDTKAGLGEEEDTKEKKYEKVVYDITQGHPLAIVVLAGLLRYKEKPVEWDAVLQHLTPGLEEAEDGQDNPITGLLLLKNKPVEWKAMQQQMIPPRETKLSNRMAIERIFSSSFDDLPHDLKSCFLYFAAYPKNVALYADHIVRMWTAEGFIKPQKGMTLEELGHRYLKELVSRCLVDLKKKNARGGIESVSVHNRLLGFLQSEAREASFIEVHDRNDILAPASVRRLSIQNDSGTYTTFTNKFPKLRSFMCRVADESKNTDKSGDSKNERREFPRGSRLGRVMRCHVREGEGGSNLKSVSSSQDLNFLCGSKFLRLISVKGLRLEVLPDEIGDMIHLRYLRVECPGLKKLPSSIRRLLNLQTLDISDTEVKNIDPYFWRIKTLRHVLAKMLTLPMSLLKELSELQTLHGVKAAEGPWIEGSSPLDKMTKLRSLELHGFNAANHGSGLEGALSNMHLLGHLKLEGDVIPACLFTGAILRCLQTIELQVPTKCPEVNWDDLRKVRPNLAELKLKNISDVPQKLKADMGDKLSVL